MRMEISFAGGKKVVAKYKGFTHRADQEPEAGGEGTAPEPVDFFFVSIGMCTAHTIRCFCEARGLPFDGMRVTATLHPDETGKRVGRVVHEVHLPPGFPEKYAKAIVRAADSCAVKRYIDHPPIIETVAVPAGDAP
jgi:ribosomal protein S12 methylthiotransferase accessory factor